MNWKELFLTSRGRVDRKTFWIGAAVLIVAGLVLGVIPVIGALASLALIYPWTCLTAKRLHDFGRSGWLVLVPAVPAALSSVTSLLLAATAANPLAAAMVVGWAWIAVSFASLGLLVSLAFLAWVGLTPGHDRVNRYGAPAEALPLPI